MEIVFNNKNLGGGAGGDSNLIQVNSLNYDDDDDDEDDNDDENDQKHIKFIQRPKVTVFERPRVIAYDKKDRKHSRQWKNHKENVRKHSKTVDSHKKEWENHKQRMHVDRTKLKAEMADWKKKKESMRKENERMKEALRKEWKNHNASVKTQSEGMKNYTREFKKYRKVLQQHKDKMKSYKDHLKKDRALVHNDLKKMKGHMKELKMHRLDVQKDKKKTKNYGKKWKNHKEKIRKDEKKMKGHTKKRRKHKQQIQKYKAVVKSHGKEWKSHRLQMQKNNKELVDHTKQWKKHKQQMQEHKEQVKAHGEKWKQHKKQMQKDNKKNSAEKNKMGRKMKQGTNNHLEDSSHKKSAIAQPTMILHWVAALEAQISRLIFLCRQLSHQSSDNAVLTQKDYNIGADIARVNNEEVVSRESKSVVSIRPKTGVMQPKVHAKGPPIMDDSITSIRRKNGRSLSGKSKSLWKRKTIYPVTSDNLNTQRGSYNIPGTYKSEVSTGRVRSLSMESEVSRREDKTNSMSNAANSPAGKNSGDASMLEKMNRMGAKLIINIAKVNNILT